MPSVDQSIGDMYVGKDHTCNDQTDLKQSATLNGTTAFLKVSVSEKGICKFSYSTDGKEFVSLGTDFIAKPGVWIGAKVGLFCLNPNMQISKGFADFEWFRIGN